MNPTSVSVLYTQDADLARRTRAFLRGHPQVRHVTDAGRREPVPPQTGPAVLLMDLKSKESREFLD